MVFFKLKSVFFLFAVCVLVLPVVYSLPEPLFSVSVLRYDPSPASQGNTVDVYVEFNNLGSQANKVQLRFVPEFPFSLTQSQLNPLSVGSVGSIETKVVKFPVVVDGASQNGAKNITFEYTYDGLNAWIQVQAPVTVLSQNAVLVIDNYKITPSPALPGQPVILQFSLFNPGSVGVKNADLKLDLDSTFSTVNSGTKKRVPYVSPGSTAIVSFELASDPATQVKLYSIPFNLTFQDDQNKQYSDTAKVSLLMYASPELSVLAESVGITGIGVPASVSLKIVNKGVMNLKYVTLVLKESDEYTLLNPSKELYLGNLDSDDFETVSVKLKSRVVAP
ncbi:MAG: hypothetical protein Q7K43_06745, partial [Candidatus Woesearchaeota archaeon]|nr:hypothetical protein [Candidatus Woesearchaeota archaeon]